MSVHGYNLLDLINGMNTEVQKMKKELNDNRKHNEIVVCVPVKVSFINHEHGWEIESVGQPASSRLFKLNREVRN